ncbi:MAG: thiolase family protein [Deltaproteobacteria bacterium]|nr:thiolase family protein [Deltaproteobacteria bacterium]
MSQDVYIIGTAMTKFGKYLEKGVKTLAGEALDLVLKDAGLSRGDIEAAWFSNSGWGYHSFQHAVRGQVALSAGGLEGLPIVNVENACASGSTALHSAWAAVKAGIYDCVLALGAEKMYDADKAKTMMMFMSGSDVEELSVFMEKFREAEQKRKEKEAREKGLEPPKPGGGGHSAFVDLYSIGARMHMEKYGTTQRQYAVIAAKAHMNSVMNPYAQYTFPMTVEEVLADREVSFPLTRAMCAPVGDGAAAVILCGENFLKRRGTRRSLRIRASVLKSGTRTGDNDICARASRAAYEMAGLGPEDIHVVEVHDATAFGELHQCEQMGFCPVGEGGPFAESGATAIGGKIPINPGGGLIARGHPVGASGLAQVFELAAHLNGEAGKRQVTGARMALAENGGGFLGTGEAAMAVHILEKV